MSPRFLTRPAQRMVLRAPCEEKLFSEETRAFRRIAYCLCRGIASLCVAPTLAGTRRQACGNGLTQCLATARRPCYRHLAILIFGMMEATFASSEGADHLSAGSLAEAGHPARQHVEFAWVGDHAVMRVSSSLAVESASGYGLLKSPRTAVPADLDPASLVKR